MHSFAIGEIWREMLDDLKSGIIHGTDMCIILILVTLVDITLASLR